MSSKDEPLVVQYETKKSEFKYERFWDTRTYEDRAERLLLKRLMGQYPDSAKWITDIGGSFGRLINLYATRFKNVAIMDYATNEFYIAKEPATENGIDLSLVAGNAYHLPFADSSQKAVICIRVMHHLEDPAKFLNELYRTLDTGGVAIIEAANKNHLKLFFKSLLRFDFSDWKAEWIDVGKSGLQDSGSFHLIRNYRPSYLAEQIRSAGFVIKKERSISWFRRTPLSKLPKQIIDPIEWVLQQLSGLTMMGPSNWYVLAKSASPDKDYPSFDQSLIDPKSGKKLTKEHIKKVSGTTNGATYLDLRYPRPRL